MSILAVLKKLDWVILAVIFGIVGLSVASIYSINDASHLFIQRQIVISLIGFGVMLAVAAVDYRVFRDYSSPAMLLYGFSVILLVVVLASHQIRGISAWIVLFDKYQFQPSEFGKLALLILLAKYFSQKHTEIYKLHYVLASAIYAIIPAGLTFLQPDFGSMSVYLVLWLSMVFFAGIRRKHLGVIIFLGVLLSGVAWLFVFKPYQKDRIISFINPYADARGIGYNTIQSQTTVGSGRLGGSYLATATAGEKPLTVLVPEPYTDFAFAVFAQRFGFVGVATLLGLFALLFMRMGSIATRASNNFAKLFIAGLTVLIGIHATINIGMNLGVLPITGIPLSFLSYGGSHFVTLMAGFGIVQSIKIRG